MNEPQPSHPALGFGPFVLDTQGARLTRDGQVLGLAPRQMSLLQHLTRHAGQLVTKDKLLDAVWGHRHVTESALKGAVNLLRAALGDEAAAPLWIETVPRLGYRFVGEVIVLAAPQSRRLGNLPPTPGRLIGREVELQAVPALMQAHRLVTLAGAGGCGKTRLALALAEAASAHASDGAWLVRLDALSDGQALVATVARTLQLSAGAAASAEALSAALSTLNLLVILDNCEHLLDAVSGLVRQCLAQAPGLRMLATSQQPLGLEAEQVWRLAALRWPQPDAIEAIGDHAAVALFVERVQARNPGFALDAGNSRQVAELCAGLDGLPLAIELAAARVPLLGVGGVHAHLHEQLALLTQGPRDAAPRQRTLRATLEWSHDLLSETERRVLRRLAVFCGTVSPVAAQAVMADEDLQTWAVLDALGGLIDKSMLVNAGGATADAPRTAMRLRLFDSIRSFAAERLAAAGEEAATRTRHARWMLALLTQASLDSHDTPALEWTARLQPELDNLRAALRHALASEPELAVALLAHSAMLWCRAGLKHEALQWNAAVGGHVTPALPAAVRAAYFQAQGVLFVYAMSGLAGDTVALLDEALQLHQRNGDTLNAYYDLYLLSHAMVRVEPEADLTDLWQWMTALEEPDWSMQRRRYARYVPAMRKRDTGDAAGYRQFCIEELARFRSIGDQAAIWTWSHGLALAEHDQGNAVAAIVLLRDTVAQIRSAGLLRSYPNVVALHASLLLERGDAEAVPAAREAVALLRVDGSLWWMAHALPFAPLATSRAEDAARVLGWADATVARRNERPGLLFARLRSGCETRLQQALGNDVLASRRAEGALLGDGAAVDLALGHEEAGTQPGPGRDDTRGAAA